MMLPRLFSAVTEANGPSSAGGLATRSATSSRTPGRGTMKLLPTSVAGLLTWVSTIRLWSLNSSRLLTVGVSAVPSTKYWRKLFRMSQTPMRSVAPGSKE
jgi:hypothetical protein